MENNTTQRRTVGPVTASSAVGAGVGVAIAEILAVLIPALGPVEFPMGVVLTALLAVLGGYLVKPQRPAVVAPTADADVFNGAESTVTEGETVAVPDYTEEEDYTVYPGAVEEEPVGEPGSTVVNFNQGR